MEYVKVVRHDVLNFVYTRKENRELEINLTPCFIVWELLDSNHYPPDLIVGMP